MAALLAAAPASGETRGAEPGSFDFYVLALSWSPGFCASEGGRRDRDQCAPGSGLGFVVHGLWPQNERGYPTACGAERTPTRVALDEARRVLPSEGLARHQWRKHGTCSGLDPLSYFRAAGQARDRVTIPDRFRDAREPLTIAPVEIERAFAAANPGLRPDMMAVACRRGALQEVRICLDRTLKGFVACREVDRDGCRGGDLHVDPVR
nr:ribonuclease T2 [Salinarimonas soli]